MVGRCTFRKTVSLKAIELVGFEGLDSLRLTDVERPTPSASEVLIRVKAAGINYAELEQTRGGYPFQKPLPGVMGFEAAGEIIELGASVTDLRIGDRIVAPVSSGGYAEYATAPAELAIPIPNGISFEKATSIPIQGLSAYALLKHVAKPQRNESILIQAAAGGVGLYLVQLAKVMGVQRIIALASSQEKLDLIYRLGADVAVNYTLDGWDDRVREITGGKGVDIVLEMASGDVGQASFRLLATFGRLIMFGARNVRDTLLPEQVQQLIRHNQSVIGFNFPALKRTDIAQCVPELLALISQGRVKLFADNVFPLEDVKRAFDALAARQTIGKIVLVP
jgi:NADPH2:quinone reductase